MFRGLLWLPNVLPSQTWLISWVRRIHILEVFFYNSFFILFFLKKLSNFPFSLFLSWGKLFLKKPSTYFSFFLSYFFFNLFLLENNFIFFKPIKNIKYNFFFFESGFLHGQTKRWGAVGYFIRWWVVTVSSFYFTSINTNKMPHDYWLLGQSSFYFNLI